MVSANGTGDGTLAALPQPAAPARWYAAGGAIGVLALMKPSASRRQPPQGSECLRRL